MIKPTIHVMQAVHFSQIIHLNSIPNTLQLTEPSQNVQRYHSPSLGQYKQDNSFLHDHF